MTTEEAVAMMHRINCQLRDRHGFVQVGGTDDEPVVENRDGVYEVDAGGEMGPRTVRFVGGHPVSLEVTPSFVLGLTLKLTNLHCTQYAYVQGVLVLDTMGLSDGVVRSRAERIAPERFRVLMFMPPGVERYARCPTCEEWTTKDGALRPESRCPAVRGALKATGVIPLDPPWSAAEESESSRHPLVSGPGSGDAPDPDGDADAPI